MHDARIVITGSGAITSVGRNAPDACAAIHAGISRPRRVAHYQVLDEETQDLVALTGHPIQGYTEGFTHQGRWLRLARGCLDDMRARGQLQGTQETTYWRETGLISVTNYPDTGWLEPGMEESAGSMAAKLRDALRLPIDDEKLQTLSMGHAGVANAFERGAQELRHGRLQRVLIVAADSLLAPGVLEQLGAQRRLKFEGQPVGLTPGEAGVCLLLELESSARKRNAPPQARLAGVATAQEENHRESGSTTTGTGLAKCIHQVLDLLPEPASFGGDIYADLNGEEWRAREWGYASVRIEQRMKAPEVHVPCAHVGDTGAASGALGICMALHALARGHARAGHALVLSSSERGQVGSVCLGAP